MTTRRDYYKTCVLACCAVGVFTFNGCATPSLSKAQCKASDWQSIGLNDAAKGYRPERLSEHIEACSDLAIVPDRELYMRGWNQGIRNYCVPSNAYQMGSTGTAYHGLCPADMAKAFDREYAKGTRVYCATPARGFQEGKDGHDYRGYVCPSDLEPAFHLAYDAGHDLNAARARVDSLEVQRENLEGVVRDGKRDKDRASAANDLRRVYSDLYRARIDLRDKEDRAYFYMR